MESVYHIVTIHVNETSWAHVWRLRSLYLGTGYDIIPKEEKVKQEVPGGPQDTSFDELNPEQGKPRCI
jgi:hypothetical protein